MKGISQVAWPLGTPRQDGPFKLERILKALEILGNPEKKIPFPIHIVGTNGKGSTTAFLEFILKEAGYKSHVYTSPNLVYLNERIKLAGNEISNEKLTYILEKTKKLLEAKGFAEKVSFFEGFTAVAFLAFAEEKADFSIIEAGLGGRFDATNVINSKLSILTSVSFDHTEYLGSTIKEIALEKLAVKKENIPFIVSNQPFEEVYNYALGVENSIIYGKDFHIRPNSEGFEYFSKNWHFSLPKPSLAGEHQYYNASTAIKACEVLNEIYGFKIQKEHIIQGIQSTVWRARLQKLHLAQFPNLEIFLDGAHNENGIETLIAEVNKDTSAKTVIICGFLKRKDLAKIIPKFFALKEAKVYTTSIHSTEESRGAKELFEEFKSYGFDVSGYAENFETLLSEFSNQKMKVIICGSLYLAGEVLKKYE